jgi:outer membrane protein TolC
LIRSAAGALLLGCLLAGCNLQPYRPQPLEPERGAADFLARRTDDPALREFRARNSAASAEWPKAQWSLDDLTLAALFFHPALEAARAETAAREAAVATATRAAPLTARPVVEHHSRADPGQSDWSYGLELAIPLGSRDKREARAEEARQRLAAARAEQAAAEWRVRSQVRQAFVAHFAALEDAALDAGERDLRAAQAVALERRLAMGAADSAETGAALGGLERAGLRAGESAARSRETLAWLADALGLPPEAAAELRLDFSALERTAPAPSPQALREAALRNRSDIRLGLARYAAADAGLRLAVASQYPELRLNPAYLWDQGDNIWALALGIPLQLLQDQEAPIREAEARRELEARRFTVLQAGVIADAAVAADAYAASLARLAGASRAQAAAESARDRAARALAAGQEDRLALLDAETRALEARRARLGALAAAQQAWGALLDASQGGLDPAPAAGSPLALSGGQP